MRGAKRNNNFPSRGESNRKYLKTDASLLAW